MDLIESYAEDLRLIRKPGPWALSLLLLSALLLFPWVTSDYFTYLATFIFIYSIGTMGQNLLIGYTGLISLGQAGFLAIGAYTLAHLSRLGVPFPWTLLASGLLAAFFGLLVGFPSLRLKGPYLAIATLGFGIAVYQTFTNWELLSGGRMGLSLPRLPTFGLNPSLFMYYLTFFLALLFTLLSYNLVSSFIGRAFIAIRDSDIAAEVMGVNLTRYKLLSFAISSFYTGVHGGLYAQLLGYLEPQMFTFLESIGLFVAVIVGGLGSIEGSILGAAFVVLGPQVFSGYRELVPVIFGVAILLVLIFEPRGFSGVWLKIRLYFSNWPFR